MPSRNTSLAWTASLLACLILAYTPASAQLLGEISFPNSGAEEAQADFLEGVLYLHNFEYESAKDAFRRALEIDSEFAMAYWGEAMTHNHPIWQEQDTAAAVLVLEEMGDSLAARRAMAGTEREAAWLTTIEVLFGTDPATEGLDKEERDDRYRQAMRRLHETYPEDDEAAAFYSLSILGSAHEGRDFATYMKAAAIADTVWEDNQKHPGAAHYLIHSYDDPIHAPLGLPMARVYGKIAPAAAHAQHMTSHIFVALGLWQDVVDANVVARDVQNAGFAARDRAPRLCGHYPFWLEYGYLQQGRVEDARRVLDACRESVTADVDEGVRWHYGAMRARYLIDADAWDEIGDLGIDSEAEVEGFADYAFADGLAAYYRGDEAGVAAAIEALADPIGYDAAGRAPLLTLELEGLALLESDPESALAKLNEAADSEAGRPFMFGPPSIAKPTFELLGETLAGMGRHAEAIEAYRTQLDRTPGRADSYLGLARSASAAEDSETARDAYARLADLWKHAEPEARGVAEAREQAEKR